MRRAILLVVVLASACAPKTVPLPTVTTPKFPEFMEPTIPAAEATSPMAASEARAWLYLQAGDLRTAERELSIALKAAPAFFPAETAFGYVELARKDAKAALPHFDNALQQQPAYPSALVGKGEALVALGRESDAVALFDAAVAADPTLTDVKRRAEVLKFRGAERNLAAARQAARSGHADEAIRTYQAALTSSPDSPFLYRELAAVERQRGATDAALDHFRRAVALDPTDAKSLQQIGEILESRDDLELAAKAYQDALAIEPNADVESRLERMRERTELARLPAEYRAIEEATQITRGDLAALIGVRLAPLLQAKLRPDAVLLTDVRAHWAASWIMAVTRAGVMEPFANHAFQPRTVVRRIDLAQAVARLLSRIGATNSAKASAWESARVKFPDLSPGHLAYPAASAAVASGAMKTAADGSFQPSRPVTGAEAVEAIDRLAALAGLPAATKDKRR
jgi:tetratricopeptide (TPR) repeat protein